MYVRCDESSVYSRINYVSTALTGNFSAGSVREIIKTMHTGFSAYTYCIMPTRPGVADTEETGRYDLAWKDLCSVLNALSK